MWVSSTQMTLFSPDRSANEPCGARVAALPALEAAAAAIQDIVAGRLSPLVRD